MYGILQKNPLAISSLQSLEQTSDHIQEVETILYVLIKDLAVEAS